jgi:hypothetical protein
MTPSMDESAVSRFLKSELSFYATVIVAVFSIAAMFFGLQGKIELLSQKLEYSTDTSTRLSSQLSGMEVRVGMVEKAIAVLQSKNL